MASKRLTAPEIYRLAAEGCRDPKTVERVVRGQGNRQSRAAIQEAAKRLGITLPDSACK